MARQSTYAATAHLALVGKPQVLLAQHALRHIIVEFLGSPTGYALPSGVCKPATALRVLLVGGCVKLAARAHEDVLQRGDGVH